MKQKLYIGAITVVIAGLMITSAMGMNNIGTQKKTANENKAADMTTILQQIKENPSALLNLEKCSGISVNTGAPAVQKGAASSAHMTNVATASSKKLVTMKASTIQAQQGRGSNYKIWARHPSLADSGTYTNTLLVQDVQYYNYTNPSQNFMGQVWSGSEDGGQTWGDGIIFNSNYSSTGYWGKIAGVDTFYGTMEPDRSYLNGKEFRIVRVNAYPGWSNDMINATSWWSWNFTGGLWKIEKPSIDPDNTPLWTEEPLYQGWIPLAFNVNKPAQVHYVGFFVQTNSSGYAGIWWWGANYTQCLATSSCVDPMTQYTYAAYETKVIGGDLPSGDPLTNIDLFVARGIRSDIIGGEDYNNIYFSTKSNLHFRNPAIAAYNDNVLCAYEIINTSNPGNKWNWLQVTRYLGNDITNISQNTTWTVNHTTYPNGAKIQYPAISHVYGDAFIMVCTLVAPSGNKILIGVTKDGGFNWVGGGLYVWSGDDPVHAELRDADLSDEASLAIWEYDVPGTYIDIKDNYIYNTFSIVGDVRRCNGEAVLPDIVTITNTDPLWVPPIPATIVPPNHFTSREILGFDLYDNATINVYAHAADGSEDNLEHMFLPGELEVPGQFIFWINRTLPSPLVPPDPPVQSDYVPLHPHDYPNDENKGIGIVCINNLGCGGLDQTFWTSSANSNCGYNIEIYYKFYFGDGQDCGWLGPYSEGEIATTTHDYGAIGFFNVTATCKIGIGGTESAPSDPTVVRMYYNGDINGDDKVGFGDINPFVSALTDPGKPGYYQRFPNGYYYCCDINEDGFVNFGDINPFVMLLTGGCPVC